MKQGYAISHWLLTLLIAPFTAQAIQYFWGITPHQVAGLLEVYPITLVFSIVFSLPTFIVYLICFYFLTKQGIDFVKSKAILIAVAVLGISVTQAIIKGSMSRDIIIAYSVTSMIIGVILKIRKPKTNTEDNPITT